MAPVVRGGRTLLFLSSLTPQYNDVLVEQSDDVAAYVDYFWNVLCQGHWIRYFAANGIRNDSPLAARLATAPLVSDGPRFRSPFLDMRKFGDWETYLQSSRVQRDHRYQVRRLEKRGVVFRMANADSCSSDMAWLFAQKRQSFDPMDRSSEWLRAPETEEFFTAAAREGIGSGRTWLTVLSIDGATIAALLSFREGPILYLSKTAYDYAWRRYSPGRTLCMLTIERAFREHLCEIDFGLGGYMWKDWLSTGTYRRVRSRTVRLEM